MALSAVLALGVALPSQAIIVSVSGTSQAGNQPILDFLQGNFQNVTTLNFGDYSNPANIPVGTDLFIVGRSLSSGAYDNAVNSATFNSLNIPVVSFTSFVTRTLGNRWSWESGSTDNALSVAGDEATVTAAGASVFGAAGAFDWWTVGAGGTGFNAAGQGTVGTGTILATIGAGRNLVVAWEPGDTSAGGVTFTANRLLFNLTDSDFAGTALLPDTAAGQQALVNALSTYTGLTPVPEPSSIVLLGVGALAGSFMIRRRVR